MNDIPPSRCDYCFNPILNPYVDGECRDDGFGQFCYHYECAKEAETGEIDCDIVPCGKPIHKLDLCKEHYIELKETDIDTVKPQNKPDCPNCNKPMFAAGMRARYDDKGNYLGVELDEPVYMCMECDV